MKSELTIPHDDLEWLYVPDVEYATYEDCSRKLQLFVPYRHEWKENTKYPLVIFIPGSAWYRQEMYNSIPSYAKLAEKGFVTAIVQYRESKIAKYPAQVEDIHNAVKFLLSKAEEVHIDTKNIYLAGSSSGGHIALMTAFRKANGFMDGDNLLDYNIKGVIAESAPTNLFRCAAEVIPDFLPEDFKPVQDLLGVNDVSENRNLTEKATCRMYIKPEIDLPPVLLLHGTKDCQVEVEHSRNLYQQLSEAGKSVDLYELVGVDHGGPAFWTEDVLNIIASFIKKY